jgi:2-oxoisovalerate ferredoxin oxidoreductase beta subunit
VKRVLPDSIVISYQGDGDLAGIGMTEIIHAANRGEQLTVFFINNATYGMTGGQMAPTTLLHEKTLTTPFGREPNRDGEPIAMAEVIASLRTPIYVQRCAISSTKELLNTKKAIKIGLKNQIEKKGFSFIEILSPCPTNWKMDGVQSRTYIEKVMSRYYPLGPFIDKREQLEVKDETHFPFIEDSSLLSLLQGDQVSNSFEKPPIKEQKTITIAGFGGQGILSGGTVLAHAAMTHQLGVSWLPSYGPEMRGGKASVTIMVSPEQIGSPLAEKIDYLLAMNGPSLAFYQSMVKSQGTIIINSSLIEEQEIRKDVKVYYIDATQIAKKIEVPSAASVVMITALAYVSGLVSIESLIEALPLSLKKSSYVEKNIQLIRSTVTFLESRN